MFACPIEQDGGESGNSVAIDFLFVELSQDYTTLLIYTCDFTVTKQSIPKDKLNNTNIHAICKELNGDLEEKHKKDKKKPKK